MGRGGQTPGHTATARSCTKVEPRLSGPSGWRQCGRRSSQSSQSAAPRSCQSGSESDPAKRLEIQRHPRVRKRLQLKRRLRRNTRRKRRKKRRRKRKSKKADTKEDDQGFKVQRFHNLIHSTPESLLPYHVQSNSDRCQITRTPPSLPVRSENNKLH